MNKKAKAFIALEISATALVTVGLVAMNVVPVATGIGLAAIVAVGSFMNWGGR